jgi:thiol-disulfide isomerase/thioredoxin
MTQVLAWGPFVAPLPLLLALGAFAVALAVGRLCAGAARAPVQATLVRMAWVGALAARIGFVFTWWSAYAASPLSALDVRDGGWNAEMGAVAAAFVALGACRAHAVLRRPVALASLAAVLVWLPGAIYLAAREPAGPPLPDVALATPEGTPRALRAFAGKPVVVNLWASWCGPCRGEMPLLVEAQRANPGIHVVFADQGETAADVEAFFAQTRLAADNVLLDPARTLGARYDQRAYPMTLFFDAAGRLVGRRVGELSAGTLAERLAGLSGTAPASAPAPR